jgi:hypothetical protein
VSIARDDAPETEEKRALAWGTAIHGLIKMCESDVMYAMRAARPVR